MPLSTRPLTEIEKRTLTESAAGTLTSNYLLLAVYCIFGWLVTTALVGKIGSYFHWEQTVGSWVLILIPGFWAAVCIWMGRSPKRGGSKYAKSCQKDLEDGVVQLLFYSAIEAIKVEEFEDEGSHYFLRLNDGTVLFLSGQYLYDDEENKKFPCTEFTIIMAPHSRITFGVVCRGIYFPPSKELKPFRPEMFGTDDIPPDVSLVATPWNEIEAKHSSTDSL